MRQMTIRGLDVELEQSIKMLAHREGISLNKAALRLLRAGAGLGESTAGAQRIGTRLDKYVGTMTEGEAQELMASIADCQRMDEDMWQ